MAFSEFEPPIFKRLPRNDTGDAPGHQSGFVVPAELGPFFPPLPPGTALSPVPSIAIRALLVTNGVALGTVDTVYQHQTWGGTRAPERRVTSNLKPLLGKAKAGDILSIERSLDDDLFYRLTLYRAGSPAFAQIDSRTGGRRWGILGGDAPVSNAQIASAEKVLTALANKPFRPFDDGADIQIVARVARSRAFRSLVKRAYDQKCAMCGGGLINVLGNSEIEAAHIIGRGALGSDDVRNGLALCRAHHWAFDQGMICVSEQSTVMVKPELYSKAENATLKLIDGNKISTPKEHKFFPEPSALAWHRKHVFETSALA